MFRERQTIPTEPIEPSTKCQECDSPRVTTTSMTITASTYWRCKPAVRSGTWAVGSGRIALHDERIEPAGCVAAYTDGPALS